jgi:predicted MPP superfamily phosphohydrolase
VHISDLPPFRKPKKPSIEVRRFRGTERIASGLDRFRVAHLTDMHFGRVTPLAVQQAAIAAVNAEKPDVVVITGDFVCHSQAYLDQMADVLATIEAPAYGVLGNHDYWSGADEVRHKLAKTGVTLLDNAHTTVEARGERLQIVGLDDAYTGHADRARALKGLRKDLPTLGLSHIAEEADALWAQGVSLVLAGHTHGGQVTLASLHELAIGRLIGHKYVHGLYGKRKNTDPASGAVYVSAGIGAAMIPIRLGERGRREVAIFELGSSAPALDEHHDEQPPLPGRKPSPELVAKRRAAVAKKMWKREQLAAKRRFDEESQQKKKPR